MSTRILSVIALTTLLGACASPAPSTPLSAQSLQHHHWVLEKIDGLPLLAEKGKAPDLEIGEQLRANGRGLGRELFAGFRRNAQSAEEGACTWLSN